VERAGAEPEVSVVVPTRDRVAMLRRTVHSVLAQDVAVEVLVVDEASTDGTAESIAELGDPRVCLIRHDRPLGVAAARNHGLAEAGAKWIAFVDDDDLWSPHKLSAQLAAMARTGREWAISGAVWVDPALHVLRHDRARDEGDLASRLLVQNVVPGGGSGVLASTALMRELGGFDETFSAVADWEMWIRLARVARPACPDGPLVAYTVHEGGMSRSRDQMLAEMRRLRDLHGVQVPNVELRPARSGLGDLELRGELRRGRRFWPAMSLARNAIRERDRRAARRAAAALIAPRHLAARLDRNRVDRLPGGWRDELDGWLLQYHAD
jgi:glycosyltransferase involved in cell wall biosynthesis